LAESGRRATELIPKELNDWLQVVGLFGVLGGLIFVGMQLQLDRRVAIAEGVGSALEARIGIAGLLAEHSDTWIKGIGGQNLSPSEQLTFEALAGAYELRYFTNWNRAKQLGTSVADRWVLEAAADFAGNPGLLAWWQSDTQRFLGQIDGNEGDEWIDSVNNEIARLAQAQDKND
jgi:hypothetical protein